MSYSEIALSIEGLNKSYKNQATSKKEFILKDLNLLLKKNEFITITGSSGSGKSTLLNILGLLDNPSHPKPEKFIIYNKDGQPYNILENVKKEKDRSRLVLENIGFIFQSHHLMPQINTIDNVMLPGRILNKISNKRLKNRAMELLEMVGLKEEAKKKTYELSGGMSQRVAIARALINQPRFILADEPTGQLDKERSDKIIKDLYRVKEETKCSIICVTHDLSIGPIADRQLKLTNGTLIEDLFTK